MSSIAKLKKDAAEFEQKRQFDKALARYQQILELIDEEPEEADVALFNRVGDLMLRQGNAQAAVGYYERAVDLYTEGGFFNNAIALCNKILRNAPGRSIIYYKLGCISAKKGFFSDAKQNFLEYAERMRKSGQIDEAFRALKEFADLCPEQDDIRVVLAEQLVRDGRKDEAIEQLQLLFDKFTAEGRELEARQTLTRMKAIDPAAEPRSGGPGAARKGGGLVFLDPHDDSAWVGQRQPTPALGNMAIPPGATRTPPSVTPARGYTPPSDLPLITPDAPMEAVPMPGIERGDELFAGGGPATPSASLTPIEGIEHGAFDPADASALDGAMLEIEPTTLAEPAPEARAATPSSLDALPLIQADSTIDDFSAPHDTSDLVIEEPPPPFDVDAGFAAEPPSALELPDLSSGGDVELPLIETGSGPADLPLLDVDEPPAADRVAGLRAQLAAKPDDREARRLLGEALVEQGAREAGIAELDAAMVACERAGDLAAARSLADEIVRVDPDAVRFHQKRVEYAFRTGDRSRLVDAYLALADALVRGGELTKARAVYGRVYELAPDDPRARVAVDTMGMLTGEHLRQATPPRPATPSQAEAAQAGTAPPRQAPRPFAPEPPAAPPAPPAPQPAAPAQPVRPAPSADFVDLSDWLREDEKPKSTRMIAEGVHEPEDGQDVDFQEMLERFKQGVAANVEETDYQSHHDLGIAYREMGLLDEAISEFQKALRADGDRVRTYEALGQCFVDKGQHQIAVALLRRALDDHSQSDDTLIGVLYLLGVSCQALGRRDEARGYFERVFAVDIGFRDVGARLAAVETEGARA